MAKKKVKPCPFCGSKAEIRHNNHYDNDGEIIDSYYFGRCTNLACPKGLVYDSHRKAVRAWNKRLNET